MPNLKEIRLRISSVKSTKQITSAMKMVSAAKLRRAQNAVTQLRPYSEKLQEVLYNISNNLSLIEKNEFVKERDAQKILIIVVTSNKGLCGGFNSNVIKTTIKHINEKYRALASQGKVELVTIGKKASEHFKNGSYQVIGTYDEIFDDLKYDPARNIVDDLTTKYIAGSFDKIEVIYNQFINAATQEIQVDQILPIKKKEEITEHENNNFYLFEPSEKEIIVDLLPKIVRLNFYKSLLDSFAAEHGARMTAMHKATDNASELIRELTLSYNKARQAAITNEILEIVGGAEALKN